MLLCSEQMWHRWEQLRCGASSTMVVGNRKATLKLSGTFTVRIKRVLIFFGCTKGFSKWSDYQRPQCSPLCQMRNVSFERQTNSFILRLGKWLLFLRRRKNQFKMLLEIFIVQHAQTESVYTFQPTKSLVLPTVKNRKAAPMCWILLLRTNNWPLGCLVVMLHNVF